MNTAIILALMIVIGAGIGGVTNSLAIRMLFRPYHPVYIGKWRVPFTPGLIPKRRGELAEQLGKMVVTHLLTAEGIQKKLNEGKFSEEMISFAKDEVRTLLHSDMSLAEIAETYFKMDDAKEKIDQKTDQFIEEKYNGFIQGLKGKTIGQLVPIQLQSKVDELVPKLADFILTKGIVYFNSREGKERLSLLIDRFLYGKGTLGNMISMFLGNERLVDKVQPEIIKFLEDRVAKELLVTLIQKEWHNVKERSVDEFLVYVQKEDFLPSIQAFIKKQIPLLSLIESPLSAWASQYEATVVNVWVPKGVQVITNQLINRIEPMMKKLDLEDVVRGQVETFSVERLEEMVLSISRREFKMITYLGALLGGLIGFVQGMIVLFIR